MSLRTFAFALGLCISGAAVSAGAQDSDIIRGKVTGPDSLPLENVKVTAMSLSTNQSISKNTNKDGRYTIIFPNGGGDYMVTYAAIGFQPTQKEVKREQDEAILIADQMLGKNPTMLNAIRVTAQRQQVDRNDDTRNGGGVGSGDRGIDLTQIGIGAQGDLAAMAASLPGVTFIPGADGGAAGFSILGLGADQNLTTLNGLNFAGSDLPRDAVTTGRVSSNPFNPTQGGFSGGQLSLRTSPGTNFVTQSVHFTMDSKALQFTDQAGQQLGTQYNNLTASGAWRGPISLDKAYYSTSLQGSRQMSDLQTLVNTDAYALQSLGISADSALKLQSVLNALGIPTTAGVPTSKINDAFSGIAQIDWTPSAGHNFTFTGNGSFRRAQAAGINSVRQIPTNGGQSQSFNTALQARHSSYFGNGFLDETSTGLQLAKTAADPYVVLPDANIRVASTFADGTTGSVQTLTIGGNPGYPTDSKTLSWQTTNSTSWISMDNKHRWMLTEDVRVNQTQTDNSRNRLGTYTYNSLADFPGQPASFTRLLSPRVRKGNDLGLAFALSDTYRPTQRLQIQYGPRIDVLRFNVQPLFNDSVLTQFGERNDHVPTGVFISPRIGFSYGFGTNAQIAGFQGAQRGTKYQISGGVGKFQNIPNSSLVSSAVDNTGLPSALQQITCVGTSVPTDDWSNFIDHPELIPTDCVNGNSVFANTNPNVSLFAKGYTPQASWRSALSFGGPVLNNGYRVGVTGTLSVNQNQQGTIDLNFNNDPSRGFALANEGNRPVFVAPTAIVTTTGAIGSSASRKVTDFSRVTSFVSDLQSISKQVSFSLSPILFNVNYSWSLNYTLQSVRDQQRGFTANTANDPNTKEWARASSDSRHQIQGNFRYTFHNAVTLSTSARLSSGTPYTPLVSGDINGDGQSNDRAFIFDPATLSLSDPTQAALRTGIENVLATSPAKDCLTSQTGLIAGRNSCQAPWFFNINSMNVSFVSTALHLPQRATFRIGVTNVLTGVDLLAHGGNNLHGWGQQPQLDPALLFVRGFDPATNTFKYDVNPRFGNSRLQTTARNAPFRLTLDVTYDIGPERERQQLNLTLRTGRRGDITQQKMNEQQLFGRYQNSIPNPFDQILRQMDTLQLTTDQADSLASLNRIFSRYRDETWRPIAKYLAALPDDYDLGEAWDKVKTAQDAVLEKMVVLGPAARNVLTRSQMNKLPPIITIFLDENSIRAYKPGNSNGRGRFGGG